MNSEEIPSLVAYLQESGFDLGEFTLLLSQYQVELSQLEPYAFREMDSPDGILTYLELVQRNETIGRMLQLISSKA